MLLVVEQCQQESRAAAEAAKQRALTHACGVGDGIHRHSVRAYFVEQLAGGVQQQGAVAGCDGPLADGILRKVDRKQGYFLTRHNRLIVAAGNQTDHGPYCRT
ncbi:Uncharacterised protein [Mycobacteroides abscessus subsp. abscessus]|nr:Uncharacterised protein [Mycobacteroides abscessus subsp. abscessus]